MTYLRRTEHEEEEKSYAVARIERRRVRYGNKATSPTKNVRARQKKHKHLGKRSQPREEKRTMRRKEIQLNGRERPTT